MDVPGVSPGMDIVTVEIISIFGSLVGKLVVFAGYPVGAVLENFLFPDGHDLLQPVDRFVASQERLLAVGAMQRPLPS